MQKFVKVFILISCTFLALAKTAGSQIFVQNAVQRSQTYIGVQKDVNLLDESLKASEQKEPNLKINLSAHLLGDIHEASLVFVSADEVLSFYIRVTDVVYSLTTSQIFRPPRTA